MGLNTLSFSKIINVIFFFLFLNPSVFYVVNAFYFPGISIKQYKPGGKDPILLFANKIFSEKTQLPYSYFQVRGYLCSPTINQELSLFDI